jgi:hypothetical protein
MAHINTIQESMDLDKMKPKIKKAKKQQTEFEKGKRFVLEKGSIGNKAVLKSVCPICDGTDTKKIQNSYYCNVCKKAYISGEVYHMIKNK